MRSRRNKSNKNKKKLFEKIGFMKEMDMKYKELKSDETFGLMDNKYNKYLKSTKNLKKMFQNYNSQFNDNVRIFKK